eukprot:gene9365-9445_t
MLLHEEVMRLCRAPAGRVAVVLHLSRLVPPAPRPYHIRIARALLQDTAARHGGQMFTLGNGDMVLLCTTTPPPPEISGVRPRGCLAADPEELPSILSRLLRADTRPAEDNVNLWRLDGPMAELTAYLLARMQEPEGAERASPDKWGDRPSKKARAMIIDEDAAGQISVINALGQMIDESEIGDLMQRQSAVLFGPGAAHREAAGGLRPIFQEVTVSMAALEARHHSIASDARFAASEPTRIGAATQDPFLMRHLAGRLDRRVLQVLLQEIAQGGPLDILRGAAGGAGAPAMNLNLTIPSVLSPEFARLATTCAAAEVPLGIEISLIEAMLDPLRFASARAVLAEHGLTLVLDDVSHTVLAISRPGALLPDLIKLEWSPRLSDLADPDRAVIDGAIADIDPARIVLHRAETEAALRWGVARGIRRFQGRHVDAMLGASRIVACAQSEGCALRQCVERASAIGRAGRAGCRNLILLDLGTPQASPSAPERGTGHLPQRALEALLLSSYVRECWAAGIARRACVIHLSRLPQDRMRPHHLRLARAAIEPLAHADRARVFTLPNRSIVALWRGQAEGAVLASRTAITHLFSDGEDAVPPELLWEDLDIPGSVERLLLIADESSGLKTKEPAEAPGSRIFDPATLQALETQLANADVARFARRNPVHHRGKDGKFRIAWERRSLCIDEVAATLAPQHAPQSDPWLFLRLTRTLDRRMLALLAAPGELSGAGPFSINLNVSSILAPGFLRFDTALPSNLRGHVTLDLKPADVLADPAAFLFARDFVRARGYRMMLRNVTADLLPVLPVARLGVELLQLQWSEACAALEPAHMPADLAQIVLSRADSANAIAWGVTCGISLFQGMAVAERTILI